MHSRDRLCPSLDTLVPFDSEKPYDIKDVIFNVSVVIYCVQLHDNEFGFLSHLKQHSKATFELITF